MPSKNEIEEVLKRYGAAIVKRTKENMQKPQMRNNKQGTAYYSTPINTGTLLRSVRFEVKYFGKYWKFQILAEDYFGALDEGRSPTGRGKYSGMSSKPMPSLYNWVKSKRLVIDTEKGIKAVTNKKASKITDLAEQQKSLAFLIERKIHQKGFKGYGFFAPYLKKSRILEFFREDLSKALGRQVEIDLSEIRKQLQVSK